MKTPIFTGSAAALATPFDPSGALDLEALDRLIRRQLESGTRALVVCATTGECATLSDGEWELVLRRAVTLCQGKIPVIAGAGRNSTQKTVELCRRAGEGLAAIPGMEVFRGPGQTGVLSFRHRDIPAETLGEDLSRRGVALRTGLHCAPLAHENAGTLETGTLRASFSVFNREEEVETFLGAVEEVCRGKS